MTSPPSSPKLPTLQPHDHPDYVGGMVWTDMEIRAIQRYAQSALLAQVAEKDAEIAALRAVLIETRRVLGEENSKGVFSAIKDTIWRGPAETLFDYLDAAIDSSQALAQQEAKP